MPFSRQSDSSWQVAFRQKNGAESDRPAGGAVKRHNDIEQRRKRIHAEFAEAAEESGCRFRSACHQNIAPCEIQ